MESQNWEDPALKHQPESQERQLQQDLQRQGVSPAGQQAALTQFRQNSQDQLFTRSQELKNQMTQRGSMQLGAAGSAFGQSVSGIGAGAGLQLQAQNQGFNQAMQGYGALQSQLQAGQQGIGALAQLGGQQFSAGQSSLAFSRQLNADPMSMYSELGQFKFSGDAKNAIKSGAVGPGTFQQQTGFVRGGGQGGIKDYSNYIGSQERPFASGQGGPVNYGSGAYQDNIDRIQQQKYLARQQSWYPNRNFQ
jgi:hypothetical protein